MILALDGLESSLVAKWELKILLQKFHGRYYIGGLSKLYTPLIWASILVGANIEEKGYTYDRAVRKSMGKIGLLHIIKKNLVGEEKRSWLARKILKKIGLLEPPKFIMPPNLLRQTFLKQIEIMGYKVFALEIPGYNEKTNGIFRLEMPKLTISGKLEAKRDFIRKVMEDAEVRIEKTEKALRTYDLVMTYIPLPDLAHHLFFKQTLTVRLEMLNVYKWLEKKASILKDAYDLNFKAIVLSDHGFDMKNYDHTNFGFWSANFPTQLKSYEEICPKILKWCNLNG